jgi:hypothetical protein
MSTSGLTKLWAAFWRIKKGQPLIVSVNDPISFDLVALEAGFGRGYLKANRPQHAELRAAISTEIENRTTSVKKVKKVSIRDVTKKKNDEIAVLRARNDMLLNKVVMLMQHIHTLEKESGSHRRPRLVYSQPD